MDKDPLTGSAPVNLQDNGQIAPFFVSRSHDLLEEKKAEYKIKGQVIANVLHKQSGEEIWLKVRKYYNTIHWDARIKVPSREGRVRGAQRDDRN